jgi:hypothetical protein
MTEIGMSGSMSGERKRSEAPSAVDTAPLSNSASWSYLRSPHCTGNTGALQNRLTPSAHARALRIRRGIRSDLNDYHGFMVIQTHTSPVLFVCGVPGVLILVCRH